VAAKNASTTTVIAEAPHHNAAEIAARIFIICYRCLQ
jgi:hypothetical protein